VANGALPISVTSRLLGNAQPGQATDCVLARALSEQYGGQWEIIRGRAVRRPDRRFGRRKVYRLDAGARRAMRRFDRGRKVIPQQVSLRPARQLRETPARAVAWLWQAGRDARLAEASRRLNPGETHRTATDAYRASDHRPAAGREWSETIRNARETAGIPEARSRAGNAPERTRSRGRSR
jgi:hypothetical protein